MASDTFSQDTPKINSTIKEAVNTSEETPHILLVEDSPIIQMVTKTLLNDAGFQVDIAGTGAEAIAAFSPGKYGMIYMDIGLPDMDGCAVTRAIREKEKNVGAMLIPIVALTGHGVLDIQDACKESGMQGILSKPIKHEQIKNIWRLVGKGESINVEGLTLFNQIPY